MFKKEIMGRSKKRTIRYLFFLNNDIYEVESQQRNPEKHIFSSTLSLLYTITFQSITQQNFGKKKDKKIINQQRSSLLYFVLLTYL